MSPIPAHTLTAVIGGSLTPQQAAETCQVSLSAVYQRLRRLGQHRRPQYRRHPHGVAEVLRLSMVRHTVGEIVRLTGVSKTHVQRIRARYRGHEAVARNLARTLGGLLEVPAGSGRVDVLTETELIEVKPAKDWKSGIGQLLAYRRYYPDHTPHLHVFARRQVAARLLSEIRQTCTQCGIIFTSEVLSRK